MPVTRLDRSVIRLSGENVADWFSGLITNNLSDDINFAALLTPQGKIIADFFAIKNGDDWLVDTAEKFAEGLIKRLSMYKLRAPIEIVKTDLSVYAAWDGTGDEGLLDPRHPDLGRRVYVEALETTASPDDYNTHRLSLGIPDSEWDFETADIFPANANMDRLNGVDFKKGCFVGQEVVSRMYRKTDVKKRMRGIRFSENLDGDVIKVGERTVGEIISIHENRGMAMIRQDRLPEDETPLMVGEQVIELIDLLD